MDEQAPTLAHPVDPCADLIGPRQIGGIYESGYWGTRYQVLDIVRYPDGPIRWQIVVVDETGVLAGEPRAHSTAWDSADRVIQQPAHAA